jgi:hypothetical protein
LLSHERGRSSGDIRTPRRDTTMVGKLLGCTAASCVILNLLGFVLDAVWLNKRFGGDVGYFTFNLESLAGIPFWLIGTMLLVCANGVAIIRVYYKRMRGEGKSESPYFPLIGANLIVVPLVLLVFVFLFARANKATEGPATPKKTASAQVAAGNRADG